MSETPNKENPKKTKVKDEFDAILENMDDTTIHLEEDDPKEADLIDTNLFADILPNMSANQRQQEADEEECIVEDSHLLGLYDEILTNSRQNRKAIDDVLNNFIDMIMNDGDATSSTKEAVVNLLKIKSDENDKMTKVADLMTRIKLKSKDTFPKYLANHTHNNVRIESSKRDLIKKLDANNKKAK